MSKRIEYIDIARGIGILLVALGHSDFAQLSPFAYQVVYSFHVPLFFFLSGYFTDASIGFGEFVQKRFNAVLKPYLFTIFMIYFVSVSFEKMSFQTALTRIAKSLYGSGYYIDWGQLWFLPHLFAVSVCAYFLLVVMGKINNRFAKWLILIAILAGGVFLLSRFHPYSLNVFGKTYELFGLPFSLDVLLLSCFFFILGGEVRRTMSESAFENPILLAGAGIGALLLNYFFDYRTDLSARVYQSILINTLEAILGIFFVLALARQIELRTGRLAAFFGYIGRISLIILIFHLPIQDFWGEKTLAVTQAAPLSILAGFIMGVGGSILIHELFIRYNPAASWWFGRKAESKTVL